MNPIKRAETENLFRAGFQHHQAGAIGDAESAYQRVLAAMPDHDECLHLMGLIDHQRGRTDLAMARLRRAVALRPGTANYHNSLGGVLRDAGRGREAMTSFRKALRLQPAAPAVHRNLGCALADLGQHEEAVVSFRAALALDPTFTDAANDLGNALVRLRRPEEALACFATALMLRPADPMLRANAALALVALGRLEDAAGALREAVRLAPGYANAWTNLGNVLQELEQGAAAIDCLARGVALAPGSADALGNLGAALFRQRRLGEAIAAFRGALALSADSAEITWNLAQAALAVGDFETGWRAFESRWRIDGLAQGWRPSKAPTWNGVDNPSGKTILLFAEQGHGDTIQFIRYAPMLAARGARVIVQAQPALISLIGRMNGIAAAVGYDETPPGYDWQYPLMSLPFAFGTRLGDIPSATPYLMAEPEAAARWRGRLAGLSGVRIGLCWAGDPRPEQRELNRVDRRRSLRFDQLAPLADFPGASFVSLQKGAGRAQAAQPLAGLTLHDWTDELADFADTAALIDGLDLVISVDTAVAHLAGALGKPVWLLNRFDSCWRWLDGRDDSPWYPGLRQFRQPGPGEWAPVFARLRAALELLCAG